MKPQQIHHGGNLLQAAEFWSVPLADWLDLSTAVSPFSYPLASPPSAVWQRLPYLNPEFVKAACSYYGCKCLLPVAGSQQAIELLPGLLKAERVAVPALGYSEHEIQWQAAGATLCRYHDIHQLEALITQGELQVAVVINPNNPTGDVFPRERMLRLAALAAAHKTRLIVDEAFADATPEISLAGSCAENVIVLRSLGKFFGLAGVRVGFIVAAESLLSQWVDAVGPWEITGPSQWAAQQALQDSRWQAEQRQRLQQVSAQLSQLLQTRFPQATVVKQPLFCSLYLPQTTGPAIFEQLARKGILVRLFTPSNAYSLVRFGLLSSSSAFARLAEALASCRF